MRVRVRIYDPYVSKDKIIRSLIGNKKGEIYYGELYYSGENTTTTCRGNFYNFVEAMKVVDGYGFVNPSKITVIGGEHEVHIIDDEYNFSFTLYGSEGICNYKKIAKFWKKFLDNHLDDLGEWKNEEIINGKLERGDIGESEKKI